MNMYMIRHGESMANAEHLHAGWSQTPLSPKGEEEAQRLAELLKRYRFDKVYSSDLLRAKQTKALALPNADAYQRPLKNCGVYLFTYKNARWEFKSRIEDVANKEEA